MTDLETIRLSLENLELAQKLLELGVISPEECEAITYVSRNYLDATIKPALERVRGK